MLKILQAGIQQYVNQKLPDVQDWLEEAEEPDQIANIHWIIENARKIKKRKRNPSISVSLTTLKPLTV